MLDLRPSTREICKRIVEARQCLEGKDGLFANPAKIAGEMNELDLGEAQEVWPVIRELLKEIRPEDYDGHRPPQQSYEKTIAGEELFAFSWQSQKLGKRMYLKFALKNNRYYYVSLHRSRYKEKDV